MSKKPYHKPELKPITREQAEQRYGVEPIKRLAERAKRELSAKTFSYQ